MNPHLSYVLCSGTAVLVAVFIPVDSSYVKMGHVGLLPITGFLDFFGL